MSDKSLHDVENEHIRSVLEELRGNMSKAAQRLGIGRRTLYRRCRAMGFFASRCRAYPSDDPADVSPKEHYKVICISLYNDDLRALDEMVESLKTRGLHKANRSALIRYALSLVNVSAVPKGL